MYYNVSNCQKLKNELLNYIKYNVKQISGIECRKMILKVELLSFLKAKWSALKKIDKAMIKVNHSSGQNNWPDGLKISNSIYWLQSVA